jgi:hypothetical protein
VSEKELPCRPCATCTRIFSPSSRKSVYCRDCYRVYYREYRRSGRKKGEGPNCGIGIQGYGGGRPRKGLPEIRSS